MQDIFIPDQTRLDQLKNTIKSEGISSFHVVADFDRTLTYGLSNGSKASSLFARIRKSKHMPDEYSQKAHAMAEKYYPIEFGNYSMDVKIKAMREWWLAAFDLLKQYNFTYGLLEQIIDEIPIKFREGAIEMIDLLHEKNVPMVIMSAGVGNMIEAFLKKEGKLYDNIHIVSNFMIFKDGKFEGVKEPVIHSFNKHEIDASVLPFFHEIRNRKNALLMGDLPEDIGMAGPWCRNVIKAGFLNSNVDEDIDKFSRLFDVIILNDSSMHYINEMLKEII